MGAYTSLLSALDRDGRWEVALDAFGDTLADGVEVPWRTTTGAMVHTERRTSWYFPMKGDGPQTIHRDFVWDLGVNPWPLWALYISKPKSSPMILAV